MHENILEALRSGAHEEALALARAAIEADPADAIAHRLLAQALRLGGDPQGALEALDRAVAVAPDDSDLHFQRAGLLLGSRDLEQAREVLDRSIELNPNQLGAYVVQAELALGRGDLDEAERLVRIATRIAPEHPLLLSTEAMIALRRGNPERAMSLITGPLEQAPEEPRVLNAAAFIYMANDHLAFAEQTFRRLRELTPEHPMLRRVLAELLARQQRPAEALEELAPLLEAPGQATPETCRFAGGLALGLGDPVRALEWLRVALAAMPEDERSLDLAMRAWSRLRDAEGARNTLEALLSTSPQVGLLWRARFSVETSPEAAQAVLERWLSAHPESVDAHEAQVGLQTATGDLAAAEATVRRILELSPGHVLAQGRLLDLLATRDPQAAVDFAQGLVDRAGEAPEQQRALRGWLARAHDIAGEHSRAAEIWSALHAEVAAGLIPLPAPGKADAPRKEAAEVAGGAPAVGLLAGLPGSGIEHVARLLAGAVPAFRADRIGPSPPQDPLQNINTLPGLSAGTVDAAEVAAKWRAALPARGLAEGAAVIDWLLWWDNALLDVIRPHLSQARILLTLRDPRDMLLNWLAFGAPVPMKLGTPREAAQWLADSLEHVAVLQEQALHPHVVLRVDETVNDPKALAQMVGEAIGVQMPEPPPGLFQGGRFGAGHWRAYADALAGPFATLTPVAVRLGYPET